VKVLLAFLALMFVIAAIPRAEVLRRRPVILIGIVLVVAYSFTKLSVIGV
jgi:hypothetical protein